MKKIFDKFSVLTINHSNSEIVFPQEKEYEKLIRFILEAMKTF
jgi:hypothetical protein